MIITAASTGNASTVNMVSVTAGSELALGFSVGQGTPGQPEGIINPELAVSSGELVL